MKEILNALIDDIEDAMFDAKDSILNFIEDHGAFLFLLTIVDIILLAWMFLSH